MLPTDQFFFAEYSMGAIVAVFYYILPLLFYKNKQKQWNQNTDTMIKKTIGQYSSFN